MSEYMLNVAKEFSVCPVGRFKQHGDHTGEGLRELILEKLNKFDHLVIDFDGVIAGNSSVFDEAFAGLIRKGLLSYDDIKKRLTFVSNKKPDFITEINQYLEEERSRSRA